MLQYPRLHPHLRALLLLNSDSARHKSAHANCVRNADSGARLKFSAFTSFLRDNDGGSGSKESFGSLSPLALAFLGFGYVVAVDDSTFFRDLAM